MLGKFMRISAESFAGAEPQRTKISQDALARVIKQKRTVFLMRSATVWTETQTDSAQTINGKFIKISAENFAGGGWRAMAALLAQAQKAMLLKTDVNLMPREMANRKLKETAFHD